MSPSAVSQTIDHLSGELSKQLTQYGPHVWDAVVAVKRAQCIGALVEAFLVVVVLATASTYFAKKTHAILVLFQVDERDPRWAKTTMKPSGATHGDKADATAAGAWIFVSGVASVITGLVALMNALPLFDEWNWIGAFAPAVAVTHDIMVKALGT